MTVGLGRSYPNFEHTDEVCGRCGEQREDHFDDQDECANCGGMGEIAVRDYESQWGTLKCKPCGGTGQRVGNPFVLCRDGQGTFEKQVRGE